LNFIHIIWIEILRLFLFANGSQKHIMQHEHFLKGKLRYFLLNSLRNDTHSFYFTASWCRMSILRLPKYHNPIGVGAFVVVIDAPAVGGFGEFLVIDEN